MNNIDFRDLPSQSNLFLDYIYDYEKVSKYFNGNFRESNDILQSIKNAKERKINRMALTDILLNQNEAFSDPKTIENINLLQDENTFAVVTGQQIGIYSGPLYTIYKIITAIKLSQKLSNEYPEYKFVPIFWLESEDHDFLEINKVKIIDKNNNYYTNEYFPEGKPVEKNFGAAGEIIFDEFINTFNDITINQLTLTEYIKQTEDLLKDTYRSGSSLLESFIRFLSQFFKNSGLIFINSNTPDIKKLLKPIFEKELNTFPRTSEIVIHLSAELEEIYHAQVKARPINIFFHHKKGRYPIEVINNEFTLKGIRQKYTKAELDEMLLNTPEVFSPNVILRPICQDSILPTCMYIAGPGEIGYFAQYKPVYDFFEVQMPIIYPRASITILENKIQRILNKYNLMITDFFIKYDSVVRKVNEDVSSIKIDQIFNDYEKQFNSIFEDLQVHTMKIDKTLIGALDNSKEKINHIFSIYKDKLFEAQKRNNKTAIDQIEKVNNYIFPKNNFQERELNIIYFLNKYSFSFMNRIFNDIDIELFQHQIIEI